MPDKERLGLAYIKLNRGIWDEEILGEKPKGFDNPPQSARTGLKGLLPKKRIPQRYEYTVPAMQAIKDIIGPAECSKAL